MTERCSDCGEPFETLAKHWSMSRFCDGPTLDKKQLDTTTGLLLGGARIEVPVEGMSTSHRLMMNVINSQFIEYLSEVYGVIAAQKQSNSHFMSKSCLAISDFDDEDMEINKESLRIWYALSGDIAELKEGPCIYLRTSYMDELHLKALFYDSNWRPKIKQAGQVTKVIFDKTESISLSQIMSPVPGFEDKWSYGNV